MTTHLNEPATPRHRSRAIARAGLATAALVLFVAGCASNPAARRATTISSADKEAKAALASENSIDPAKIPARTFAVMPFSVASRDTLIYPLGFGLADLLINDLAQSPELKLVERVHTNAIVKELALVDEGIVDARQGPRVGRLVGARRLLIGSASMSNATTLRLDARVVDVIAGTVQDVLSAEAPLDRVIDAEKALALLILERLGIAVTPAQRARIEQRQTTQLAALVAYGRGVESEARGDAAGATAAFEEASRLDAAFAMARGQVASGGATSSSRSSSVQRVAELATQAVNATAPVRIPEAADAPLSRGSALVLTFTVRVTP